MSDESRVLVGERYAAASGVYGGGWVPIDESRVLVGERYAAASGVYGGGRS